MPSDSSSNPVCTRLGISSPRVEDARGWKDPKLSHLMILALLERGGPMAMAELTARIRKAGFGGDRAKLETSLLKAWHGKAPITRGRDGRFWLIEESMELEFFVSIHLKPPGQTPVPDAPPDIQRLPDHEPLQAFELDALGKSQSLNPVSDARLVAAVLDAEGAPLLPEEIETRIPAAAGKRPVTRDFLKCRPCAYLRWTPDGRLAFDPEAPLALEMRRAIRAAVHVVLKREAEEADTRRWHKAWIHKETIADLRHAREAFQDRAALVHAVPSPEDPRALGILDLTSLVFEIAVGPVEVARATTGLGRFTSLVGLHVGEVLHALHIDPAGRRLVDLRPPQKTKTIAPGRTLKLTMDLLMESTLGHGRRLHTPANHRYNLERGRADLTRSHLDAELRNLCRFYDFGVLHGRVRLRWGFCSDSLYVRWALPGQESLYSLLNAAHKSGATVEIVRDFPPSWERPWEFARRVTIEDVKWWEFVARGERGLETIDNFEVYAARTVPGTGNVPTAGRPTR